MGYLIIITLIKRISNFVAIIVYLIIRVILKFNIFLYVDMKVAKNVCAEVFELIC